MGGPGRPARGVDDVRRSQLYDIYGGSLLPPDQANRAMGQATIAQIKAEEQAARDRADAAHGGRVSRAEAAANQMYGDKMGTVITPDGQEMSVHHESTEYGMAEGNRLGWKLLTPSPEAIRRAEMAPPAVPAGGPNPGQWGVPKGVQFDAQGNIIMDPQGAGRGQADRPRIQDEFKAGEFVGGAANVKPIPRPAAQQRDVRFPPRPAHPVAGGVPLPAQQEAVAKAVGRQGQEQVAQPAGIPQGWKDAPVPHRAGDPGFDEQGRPIRDAAGLHHIPRDHQIPSEQGMVPQPGLGQQVVPSTPAGAVPSPPEQTEAMGPEYTIGRLLEPATRPEEGPAAPVKTMGILQRIRAKRQARKAQRRDR